MRCSIRRTIRTFFFAQSRTSWVLFGHSPAMASMSRNFHEYARLVMRTFPSTSLARPPPPRLPVPTLKNPSLFPTTVRFLELHGSHTSAICLRVHVQGCIRACTSTRVRHSGPLVIFDSGSQFHVLLAFFFVRRLDHRYLASLFSLTSIECLDRFLRHHLSFSMGICR